MHARKQRVEEEDKISSNRILCAKCIYTLPWIPKTLQRRSELHGCLARRSRKRWRPPVTIQPGGNSQQDRCGWWACVFTSLAAKHARSLFRLARRRDILGVVFENGVIFILGQQGKVSSLLEKSWSVQRSYSAVVSKDLVVSRCVLCWSRRREANPD